MGLLINGEWHDQWYDTEASGGKFVREDAQFRHCISQDGKDSDGNPCFEPESGRYHLVVSLACPWAHRTLIFRQLKGLQEHIPVSVVHPDMLTQGWEYRHYDATTEHLPFLYDFQFHHQLYTKAKADYTGRVTVPVLWDTKTETIVSNESSEIIRMLNAEFNHITGNTQDYYPEALREEIHAVNDRIYHDINNGVYKCGFATSQEAYEEAFTVLFDCLDWLEDKLAKQRYLIGNQVTESDWRLFTTLIRFDHVYYNHFKTNLRRISDYPHLAGYVRELYQQPGIAETVNMDHIKRHYFYSHDTINPTRIVPVGPSIDFTVPHNRNELG
jgi:putative glutathione S-transferase